MLMKWQYTVILSAGEKNVLSCSTSLFLQLQLQNERKTAPVIFHPDAAYAANKLANKLMFFLIDKREQKCGQGDQG